jgi:pimeloyl-ACP methyl ester carboxylesterase
MTPSLILLPGLMCDQFVWAPQIKVLSSIADCTVQDYGQLNSLSAMAEQVLATAPTETFNLAGHSMGGRVALEVLRLAPHRVQRLALLDTGAHPLAAGAAGERERTARMSLLAQAKTQGMRSMCKQWARAMVHADRLGTPLFEDLLEMSERSSPAQFEAQVSALLTRPDATALLLTIICPTLVLCGEQDSWSPPEQHQAMYDALPNAELRVIPHCGHMSTLEQADVVSDALATWLASPTTLK